MKKQKVVILVSGGMDSVTALYDASKKYRVICGMSFDYGAKHNAREITFAAFHCQKLRIPHFVIPLDFIGDLFTSDLLTSGGEIPEGHYEEATMKQTVVPFRNGIMMAIAAGYAESVGAEGIVIAAHQGDHAIYPDCREEFMASMGEAIRLGTYRQIEVIRPFIAMNKAQIAKRGEELRVDFSYTWSCYKGGDIHCGRCGTCVERREAFIIAGVKDLTVYAHEGPLPAKPGN
ncbi:MAG: 7-cyano-7-deazaguanine synthase QueC [Syntrophobacterales bacterium]|nr:7-cyano-7-deazaguanine synthase QueC [Syntrophobacterales bacterium]